jgi:VWFA-related protein
MSTRSALTVLLVVLGSVLLPAQEQPPVTFRVEVNYVEIDAVVTDAQGNFVPGLTKDDFEIVEEGKPQALSILTRVDIPVERADAPLFSPTAIEPDVQSNTKPFNGRVIVLVLDDLQTHFARSVRVREAARQFIERYLGENDIAAVVQTGARRDGAQEFTGNRRLLLAAVQNFAGQKARSATLDKLDDYYMQRDVGSLATPRDLSEAERVFKARNTYSTLRQVANYLAGVRGRRKAVVVFSEGVDYPIDNPIYNRYASDIRNEMQAAIAAATRANVSFYGVDPRGLSGLGDEAMDVRSLPDDPTLGLGITSLNDELRRSQDSLRTISDETGGFAAVDRNDLRTAFSNIIQDNSSYYLLGYYSSDTRRDGRFRRVQVRVKRPGLTVRARRGYVAPSGKAASAKGAPEGTASPALREALDSPIPVSGLGLRVFAAPLKGAAPNGSIALTLEVQGQDLKFAPQNGLFTDDIEVSVIAVDRDAKIREGGRDVVQLRLRPQTHDVVSRAGVRIARRLELPPGHYQLRVGARDGGSGAVGSVHYEIDVPDFAKSPMSMSGLFLTASSSAGTPSVNPDADLKGIMPAPPTAVREFARGDRLSLFTEVYDNQTDTPHRVAITASVIADDGKVVHSAADERRSEELQGGRGGYGYTAAIDTSGFAPGRYVLRVQAETLLAKGPAATRELEFRIR